MMDIARTLAMLASFIVLSLILAIWVKMERKQIKSDCPALTRFMALLMFLPLWILSIFSLAMEISQWQQQ